MSKAVKWQIPFVSTIEKTKYRIDIYAEGYSGNPIQLLGGPQPFVTEENKSDDFFTPVRSQTGNIQVCTAIPAGGTLSLDDILPANNIDHPVRLVSISGNTETIEWQGFLSCEAYSQSYTSIPQILTIPVISVLEAMDSVDVDQTRSSGMVNIAGATYNVLNEINIQCGLQLFTYINFSRTSWRIFQKVIDQTLFFKRNEYNNENSTTYIVSGISTMEAMRRLCTFMGWTAREQGTELYLEYIGESIGMYRVSFSSFVQSVILNPSSMQTVNINAQNMANCVWRATDHRRNINQGAKSVEVLANLERYAINLDLPPFPYGETYEIHRQYNGPTNWIYILASIVNNPYNNVVLNYYKATLSYVYGTQSSVSSTTLSDLLANLWNAEGIVDIYSGSGTELVRTGAFFAKVAYENQDQSAHSTNEGVFMSWLPRITSTNYSTQPIFSMRSMVNYSIGSGYLKLSASMDILVVNFDNHFEVVWTTKETQYTDSIQMHIRFGNKYWNGSSWVSSLTKVLVDIEGSNFKKNWTPSMPVEETDGYLIPINNNTGELEIAIYPQNNMPNANHNTFLLNTFFSSLTADYVQTDNDSLSDRSSNHYFRLLGLNFSEDVSVDTDMASYLNNRPSPSLIMNDSTTPASSIDYTVSGGTESRRPEVDLLNRLAAYYGEARQTLELNVKHPTAAALPLLKLNGISPDTKKYLPLAESRDWIADVATLKCFETPE